MDNNIRTINNTLKLLTYLGVIVFILAVALIIYNKTTEKKAINSVIELVSDRFNASVEYSKKSNRIIVEKYLKNEGELYELTKEALPSLSIIGDYNVVDLLSMRAYYGDNKSQFQFYDIRFKDINKIKWESIRDFDGFLNEINKLN